MHLDDYKVNDQVELTRDVCERVKGERGYIVKRDGQSYIKFGKGALLMTDHVKLIKAAPNKHELLVMELLTTKACLRVLEGNPDLPVYLVGVVKERADGIENTLNTKERLTNQLQLDINSS